MKKIIIRSLVLLGAATVTYAAPLLLNKKMHGSFYVPPKSSYGPIDNVPRMYPDHIIFEPNANATATSLGETPSSLACVYNLRTPVAGCPISDTGPSPQGGHGAIALVDAYDNPQAENSLAVYSARFGLPACTTANGCFSVVYAGGSQPAYNAGWATESSLDIEMAHAMAPDAKIILVEADTNSNADLYAAEDVATNLVLQAGGGQVSNSWGGKANTAEGASDTQFDMHFQHSGVIYLASSGDNAQVNYPSTSSYVISAGGTSILRDSNNLFTNESTWYQTPNPGDGGGGGPSEYISRPPFQQVLNVARIVGTQRGTPDFSFDANPETGVWIYDGNMPTECPGWCVIGGTSVASPALAGILNVANSGQPTTQAELQYIYSTQAGGAYHSDWRDITIGNTMYPALPGYDFATGLGSPYGYGGK